MKQNRFRRKLLLVVALSLLGAWIAYEAETVHQQLDADTAYTSFCNVNHVVNCDVVLGSSWAKLGPFSVSLLALVFYCGLALLAALAWLQTNVVTVRRVVTVMVLLMAGGLAFSVYMASIALGVLRSLCVLCTGLYVVGLANFAAIWRLHRELQVSSHKQKQAALRRDRWVYIGIGMAVILVAVAAAWDLSRTWREPTTAEDVLQKDPKFAAWFESLPVLTVPVDSRNARGPENAPVTIVEFSDFECVHCAALHEALEDTWRRAPNLLRIVFRYFPLDSACNPLVSSRFHPLACDAAIAAECAGQQGKFWQYHDLLFAHRTALRRERLAEFARQLKLDVPTFEKCLQDPSTRVIVESDVALGRQLGVNSTPTLFVNGRVIRGALEAETLRRALLLARKQ